MAQEWMARGRTAGRDREAVDGAGRSAAGRVAAGLAHRDPSTRLRAALAAGSRPDPASAPELVRRCGVEPDFFVRDMLTWAVTRLPAATTVPLLLDAVRDGGTRARSQALHTLSKIGDGAAWPEVSRHLHDADADVARAAWRASVVLVPAQEAPSLARALTRGLGRGDRDVRRALSRALAALGDAGADAATAAADSPDAGVRAHARGTLELLGDPDAGNGDSADAALRARALGPDRM